MHGNELRLLKAYIEAKGYEIKETDRGSGEGFIFNYKVTKKPMATKKIRKSIDDSYTPEFNSAWGLYPKRAGGNSKAAAYKAWSARVSSSRFENGLESIYLKDLSTYDTRHSRGHGRNHHQPFALQTPPSAGRSPIRP